MLYPVLHRLEDEKLIESFWISSDNGRERKYYRILPAGKAALESEKKQWLQVDAVLAALWGLEPRLLS
jgi:DNA-binding PadR family transcriptional regulator